MHASQMAGLSSVRIGVICGSSSAPRAGSPRRAPAVPSILTERLMSQIVSSLTRGKSLPTSNAVACAVEKIPVTVYASSSLASQAVAQEIADLIREKAKRGEMAVLGLATGSTPTNVYDELIRLHQEEKLSFK